MIVAMKKAKVFVLKENEYELKRSLQRYGVMMITNASDQNRVTDTQFEDSIIARANRIIKELSPYQEKQKFFSPYFQVVDYDRFSVVREEQLELLKNIEKVLEKMSTLKADNDELVDLITLLKPWEALEVNTEDVKKLTFAKIYLGQVLTQNQETFNEFLAENNLEFQTYGSDVNGLAYAVVSEHDILSSLVSAGFVVSELPSLNHLVSDEVKAIETTIAANESQSETLKASLYELAKHIDEIRMLSDQMLSEKQLKRVQASETDQTIYFEGWVRSDQVDKFEKAVKKVTQDYELELRDPLPQENPPTQYKNNKFVEPFETITDMFSVPGYNEIDPNPMMSIWYWLFFGMMMGDMGYGLVMALIFGLFLLIRKPKGSFRKLVTVLFYASIPSILFGVLYGSAFGISFDIGEVFFGVPFQVFDPINDPIPMLIFSLAIGVVHIMIALALKTIKMFKEKDYLGALAESISWMLIIPGLIMLLLSGGFIPVDLTIVGIILAAVGAILVLAFSGRDKKGFFGKVTSGIGGLYGISGYLSDILSYSRILALALSSGIIAYSMNLIGGLLIGPWYGYIFGVIVFIIGHVFNFIMGLLSAYVHDSRLQYIEFYGKFFDGGGYVFQPLKLEYNYIHQITDNDL